MGISTWLQSGVGLTHRNKADSSLSLAAGTDLIFDLQSGQTLMVEDLTDVAPVEVEVSVAEVHKGDASDEKEEPRVISLALRLKGIVTELVTVGQVMHVVLFLPSVSASIGREVVSMATQNKVSHELLKEHESTLT